MSRATKTPNLIRSSCKHKSKCVRIRDWTESGVPGVFRASWPYKGTSTRVCLQCSPRHLDSSRNTLLYILRGGTGTSTHDEPKNKVSPCTRTPCCFWSLCSPVIAVLPSVACILAVLGASSVPPRVAGVGTWYTICDGLRECSMAPRATKHPL